MNFQQLKYLCGIIDKNLNITLAAESLHTSQSGISRQIRLLEDEIGCEILIRRGNRIVGVTEPGMKIVARARQLLVSAADLKMIGKDHEKRIEGDLRIATTHLHARYGLLPAISSYHAKFPSVNVHLRQGAPADIEHWLCSDVVDLAISTAISAKDEFVSLNGYHLRKCLIAPKGHPILSLHEPSLEQIAHYPFLAYDERQDSGRTIQAAFDEAGIKPNIVLSALDADVIKAHVEANLGIAIIQAIAYEPKRDIALDALAVDHLFPEDQAFILMRSDKYLTRLMAEFITEVNPFWTTERVRRQLTRDG